MLDSPHMQMQTLESWMYKGQVLCTTTQALMHGEFTSILKPFLSHREGMREVPCMNACIWASGDEVARIAKADHHSPLAISAISISHSLYLYEYMLLPLLLFHAKRTNNCSHSRRTCRIDPVLC